MNTPGKRLLAAPAVTGACLASVAVTASPAVAVDGPVCADGGFEKRWLWEQAGGNNIGQACYWDSGNRLNVDDQEEDGHSLVLDLYNPRNGRQKQYWDHGGAPGPGSVGTVTEFADNILLQGRLCKGEWSATNPVVLWDTCRGYQQVRL
ncbi:hypothetical protein ACFYOT_31150 [Saccharothrix saharensis]|uniref:hypothetical protein n=1 Tax=Saccharothrix saharensis TaxID=571190 RepID=UPI00369FC189